MIDFKKIREQSILAAKRAVKNSLTKDLLVIQAINCIDDTDKVSSIFASRLREWYGYYNPEFTKIVHSNEKFSELVVSMSRKDLLRSLGVEESQSMGADLEKKDLNAVLELARTLNCVYVFRKYLERYINVAMQETCPNITAITGALLGAKLLSFAGSLKRLSELPASTIQLLGAEKALFRHIRGLGKSPKHGILVQHPLVEKAKLSEKGKIARAIADKLSIAAKVDYFKGKFVGDKLKEALEARFRKK
ncbi:MAG: hypothetical protein QW666_02055 [Candidatus Woesearchaeota archaeon]